MNFKLPVFIFALFCVFSFTACQTASRVSNDTPTDAFKRLHAAVQSKNAAAIKNEMSKTTLQFAEAQAGIRKIGLEEMLKNGLVQPAMNVQFPAVRDVRVKDDFAALEAQNPAGEWEDLPFIRENGAWKLAVGDAWKGTFKSPGAPASRADAPRPDLMPAPNQPNQTAPNANAAAKNNIQPPTTSTANRKK